MTPTETLHAAAMILREKANAAAGGPWRRYGMAGVTSPVWNVVGEQVVKCECGNDVGLTGCTTADDADFIALTDPTFALLVADWLNKYADLVRRAKSTRRPAFDDLPDALKLAEHIIRRAS